MKLSTLAKRVSAVLISPITGARTGMKEAYARPAASNWKQLEAIFIEFCPCLFFSADRRY
jgi:hypothetical protein